MILKLSGEKTLDETTNLTIKRLVPKYRSALLT